MLTNNVNMIQLMNMFRNGNPQEIVANMVKETANQGNPIMQNLSTLIENGNTQEIENVVRNIAKERGIDFDKEFNSFKQIFKL